jgi:predicted dehydrogenase
LPHNITRRRFLTNTAVAGAAAASVGAFLSPALAADAAPATTQSKKLTLAVVGIGGQGNWHLDVLKKDVPQANIVALCDVDANALAAAAKKVPSAEKFADFREVLKLENLDAVLIATPDHNHAVVTAAALRAGKHVYCEKPLTHTVREARAIADLAKETKLVTQMGIQIHAGDNYRRVVDLIKSGAIGPVSEVHIWNNRTNRPAKPEEAPVPPALNYDLWLGPVTERPYRPDYHPYNWRRWWAFGSGMLGDIGCHLMDVAFWALDLQSPTRIESEGSPRSDQISTEWIVAKYDFPARGPQPPVTLTWYDPPKKPPQLASWKLEEKLSHEGVMFIGDKGMLYTNYGEHRLLPADQFNGFKPPATQIASSPGHQLEWVRACLKNDPTAVGAPFSYGGLLTESALLGVVAFRANQPLEWDATTMRIKNAPAAEAFLDQPRRSGWPLS